MFLLFIPFSLYGQSITIGDDGIVRCKDVPIGTTHPIFGNTYEVVDRELLTQRRDEGIDMSLMCVSKVTDMTEMFSLRTVNGDITKWDVSSVTNMSGMFVDSPFNQPIGNWDVGNVTDMSRMFNRSPFNKPLGDWNVSSAKDMRYMFDGNSQFDQFLVKWCVKNITSKPQYFSTNSPLKEENKPFWGSCLGIPPKSNLIYPQNNSENVSRNVELIWYSDTLSTKYQLQVFDGFDPMIIDTLVIDTLFTSPITFNGNQEYNWRVRGINENRTIQGEPLMGEWSTSWSFTTQVEPVGAITLLSPDHNSTIVGLTPTLSWNSEANSQSYTIQVSADEFETTIAEQVVTDTTFTSPELSYSTGYQWRVRGSNASGDSQWSTSWSFTTLKEPLISPEQLSPFADQENVGTLVEFQWVSVNSVVSYHLQVAADETFSSLTFESSVIDTNTFILTQSLDQNSSYFWRVRSLSDIEVRHSSWSDTLTFSTGIRTSLEEDILPTEFSLNQNYPNPFNPTTQIKFSLPTTSNVRLVVYSITGQRISTLVDGSMGIGNHTVSFDGKSLSSGVYIYRLTTPEFTQTRFMSLIK